MPRPKGSKNRPKDETAPPKARKPRAAKPAKATPPEATAAPAASSPSSATGTAAEFKRPNSDQTRALAKKLDAIERASKGTREAKKDEIDKAVETQHFNKVALGKALDWRKRAQKNPAAYAIEFAHFLSYVDDFELGEIADQNRGLAINGENDPGDGEDPTDDEAPENDGEFDDGPESLVDAMASALQSDGGDFDETPPTGPSPRLSIVPGPNAPTAVPAPSDRDDEAAA